MKDVIDGRSSLMTEEKALKTMGLAKYMSETNTICYSRQIGTVISDKNGIVLSIGINGPPRHTPHTDSKEYIDDYLWPNLTIDEQWELSDKAIKSLSSQSIKYLKRKNEEDYVFTSKNITSFVFENCKTCPRKLLGYGNGVRSELCTCVHSEENSIVNSPGPVCGGILFCWCKEFSCIRCTGVIINSGIAEVHFLEGPEYQGGALWLYKKAGIPVFRHPVENFS